MKLYIQKKAFAWSESFSVYDEAQQKRYEVKGEKLTLTSQLYVHNRSGRIVAYVGRKLLRLRATFEVRISGKQVAVITRKGVFGQPRYTVRPFGWRITGDRKTYDFTISYEETVLASITNVSHAMNDGYELQITDKKDVLLMLAIVLAVDNAEAVSHRYGR